MMFLQKVHVKFHWLKKIIFNNQMFSNFGPLTKFNVARKRKHIAEGAGGGQMLIRTLCIIPGTLISTL